MLFFQAFGDLVDKADHRFAGRPHFAAFLAFAETLEKSVVRGESRLGTVRMLRQVLIHLPDGFLYHLGIGVAHLPPIDVGVALAVHQAVPFGMLLKILLPREKGVVGVVDLLIAAAHVPAARKRGIPTEYKGLPGLERGDVVDM